MSTHDQDPSATGSLTDPHQELLHRIIERPDGLHWLARDGQQEFGPFATVAEALADMIDTEDDTPEPGETLEEACQELGLAGWVDPDTGALAEDTVTRIEEH